MASLTSFPLFEELFEDLRYLILTSFLCVVEKILVGFTCKAYNKLLRNKYEKVRLLSFLGKYIGTYGSHSLLELFISSNFRVSSHQVICNALKHSRLEFLSQFRYHEHTKLAIIYERHNFFFKMDLTDFSSLIGKFGNPTLVNYFAQRPASLDMFFVSMGYVRGGHLEFVKKFVTLKNLDLVFYVACSHVRINVLEWLYSIPTFREKLPKIASPGGSIAICDRYFARTRHFFDLIKFVEAHNGKVNQFEIVRRCLILRDLTTLLYLEKKYGCVSSRQICRYSFMGIVETLLYNLENQNNADFLINAFSKIPRLGEDCPRHRFFHVLQFRKSQRRYNTPTTRRAVQTAIEFFTKFYDDLEGQ